MDQMSIFHYFFIQKKLNEEIQVSGGQALVNIGSCTLHTTHNAFRAGLAAVPHWEIDEFLTDIFYWFRNYPSRQQDFEAVQNAMTDDEISSTFFRFVDNRWLSLGPVIDRVLPNFESLRQFFLKGKFEKNTSSNCRFKRICSHLQAHKVTIVRLLFARSISADYERFLTMFQTSSPMIQQLHSDLTDMVRHLLMRFVKPELIQNKSATSLVDFVSKMT